MSVIQARGFAKLSFCKFVYFQYLEDIPILLNIHEQLLFVRILY